MKARIIKKEYTDRSVKYIPQIQKKFLGIIPYWAHIYTGLDIKILLEYDNLSDAELCLKQYFDKLNPAKVTNTIILRYDLPFN